MGFLDKIFAPEKPPRGKTILILPNDLEKELEKSDSVRSLGAFLKKKVENHIETNEDYVIGLNKVATCKISSFESVGAVNDVHQKYKLELMGDEKGLFFVFFVIHDDHVEDFPPDKKVLFVRASDVDWLGDIPDRRLASVSISFLLDAAAFYNRMMPFFKMNKLELPPFEQLKKQNMNLSKDATLPLNLVQHFVRAVICEGNAIDYAVGDALRFLVQDKIWKEPERETGFSTEVEAQNQAALAKELLEREPRTFKERRTKMTLTTMTNGLAPFIKESGFEHDWHIFGEARLKCLKCGFEFSLPTAAIIQRRLMTTHFGLPMSQRYCTKCGSLYVRKDLAHVFRLEKDFWKGGRGKFSMLDYLGKNTYLGNFDSLKTCSCGGKLAPVKTCPVCKEGLKIESSTSLLPIK